MISTAWNSNMVCSFSSAETKWLPLLHCLGLLIDKKNYSDTELLNMPWAAKCKLTQSDPITYSRYFNHKVQKFLNDVLCNKAQPIGRIKDYFYLVEFHHIHMLVWIKDAFSISKHTVDKVTDFVDLYVTCKKMMKWQNWLIIKHTGLLIHAKKRSCNLSIWVSIAPIGTNHDFAWTG